MKSIVPTLLASMLFISAVHCKDKSKKAEPVTQPQGRETNLPAPGYNFSKPEIRQLHKRLREISGINYLGNGKFAAEEDEDGTVYLVDFNSGNIDASYNFGPAGDYEDIVTLKDYYYLLNSNGDIYKVNRKSPNAATTKVFRFGKPDMEFETLYPDENGKRLVMICKSCAGNEHNSVIDAYDFDLQKEIYSQAPVYAIEEAAVHKLLNTGKKKFKPSAAAIHPVEKKLYILCSVGRLLMVCNLQGGVEKAWSLDPAIYAQPEGLAFAPNGDMYISNEGRGTKATKANIMKLTYQDK
jgi:hypothetical protein